MKLKSISKDEIESLQFDDLAYVILKEKGKKMKITDIFKCICELQNLSENAFEEQIGDFFTLLSTEKRFVQLDKGYWDLRENHSIKLETEEDDEEILEETSLEENENNLEEPYIDETKEIDDDDIEDDYKDLVILDENEIDEEI